MHSWIHMLLCMNVHMHECKQLAAVRFQRIARAHSNSYALATFCAWQFHPRGSKPGTHHLRHQNVPTLVWHTLSVFLSCSFPWRCNWGYIIKQSCSILKHAIIWSFMFIQHECEKGPWCIWLIIFWLDFLFFVSWKRPSLQLFPPPSTVPCRT